jgi:hypothetical protein
MVARMPMRYTARTGPTRWTVVRAKTLLPVVLDLMSSNSRLHPTVAYYKVVLI